jgi:hypothetical protein
VAELVVVGWLTLLSLAADRLIPGSSDKNLEAVTELGSRDTLIALSSDRYFTVYYLPMSKNLLNSVFSTANSANPNYFSNSNPNEGIFACIKLLTP